MRQLKGRLNGGLLLRWNSAAAPFLRSPVVPSSDERATPIASSPNPLNPCGQTKQDTVGP
jgi:hypothetical protein